MQNEVQLYRLLKIKERNNLAIEFYMKANNFTNCEHCTSLINTLLQVRSDFRQNLDAKLFEFLLGQVDVYSKSTKPVNSWIEYSTAKKTEEAYSSLAQAILFGEEKARIDYSEVLKEDLAQFNDIRDLLNQHVYQTQRAIENYNQVAGLN